MDLVCCWQIRSKFELIEDGIFILNDSDTIDEFFTFIKVGKRYEAQGFSIKYLKVNNQGLIDTNELQDLLKKTQVYIQA